MEYVRGPLTATISGHDLHCSFFFISTTKLQLPLGGVELLSCVLRLMQRSSARAAKISEGMQQRVCFEKDAAGRKLTLIICGEDRSSLLAFMVFLS